MKLEAVSSDDLILYKAMFCNPAHMAELGGAHSEEKVVDILQRQANYMASEKGWVYKIVPDEDDWGGNLPTEIVADQPSDYFQNDLCWRSGVGTVCLWFGEYKGSPVTEVGWGVVSKYQGRGFATMAVKLLLEKARQAEGRWGDIHVFTSRANIPSNAVAKKAGFTWTEECEVDYDGKMMQANHYVFPSAASST